MILLQFFFTKQNAKIKNFQLIFKWNIFEDCCKVSPWIYKNIWITCGLSFLRTIPKKKAVQKQCNKEDKLYVYDQSMWIQPSQFHVVAIRFDRVQNCGAVIENELLGTRECMRSGPGCCLLWPHNTGVVQHWPN